MSKPQAEPLDLDKLEELALTVIQETPFPFLASLDADQARVRPVSPVRTDGFIVYVANLKPYHKTQEIAANNKVELCYLAKNHDQVRITGVAEILKESDLLQEIWDQNPLLRNYLGSIDNPNLIVYRIQPVEVRFMKEWALEYHNVAL